LLGIFLKSLGADPFSSGIFSESVKPDGCVDRTAGNFATHLFSYDVPVWLSLHKVSRMFKASPNRTYHKSTKRKQIDPTTCERDYSSDEIEFMQALESYKKSNGRKFPTLSEILEVVRSLGYQKQQPLETHATQAYPALGTDTVIASAEATLDGIDATLRSLD